MGDALCEEDGELMCQIFASYIKMYRSAGDRSTTIVRLRKMMFGGTSEKAGDALGDEEKEASEDPESPSSDDASDRPYDDETAAISPSVGPFFAPFHPIICAVWQTKQVQNLIGRRLEQTAAHSRVRRVNRMAGLCSVVYSEWNHFWKTLAT